MQFLRLSALSASCPRCLPVPETLVFAGSVKGEQESLQLCWRSFSIPPSSLTLRKHTGSCDPCPQLVTWTFGNICSTAPGEGPPRTAWRCIWAGRETCVRWHPWRTPPWGWPRTAGCFGIPFPCRWSCSILKGRKEEILPSAFVSIKGRNHPRDAWQYRALYIQA